MSDKKLDEVYRQRAEAFMLAMAFAKEAGYEVGVREKGDWPVHVIVLKAGKEVALHIASKDVVPELLHHEIDRPYDGHTDNDKEDRIREYVAHVFGVSPSRA